ncbi:hypothetical protein PYW08_007369 [Mythimna loreyi]|uniref:Uncharacterized protein n=1 Tax=Mythimna loreyi TaxID=667449 RepID=A0ACC2RBF4_9NEOP|nr:hypothetical protein PYW08_007369 [Mythimna loreyi]
MAAAEISSLERLSSLESILIHQEISIRKGNHYEVRSGDDFLFEMIEEYKELGLFSEGKRRAFTMEGVDLTGDLVFSFRRPLMVLSDKIVLSVNGLRTSAIRLKPTSCTPCFSISDARGCPVYLVKGKIWTNASSYQLQTTTKSTIGSIQRKDRVWRNARLSRKDDYEYVISFPADLAVHFKLAVIGACVLIDYRFQEYRRR